MTSIRAMRADDAEAVAALYLRVFRGKGGTPRPDLTGYIRSFYCDGPFREPDLPSLVYVKPDGRIAGFVGINAVPMLWGKQKLRAAFGGSFMVENPSATPLAGASLLKAVLSGPQDISVSETANPTSQAMWERLRGDVLPANSLDWIRVLRPAGFALATAANRLPFLRHARPLAGVADRVLQRRSRKSSLAMFLPEARSAGIGVEPIGREEIAALVHRFTEPYAVRPDWNCGYGEHVLAQALDKPDFGAPAIAAVLARGTPVGAFVYHAAPGGIARVLQILAAPGKMGIVLQCLFADALARGAVALRGRSSPAILHAAPGRSIAFAPASSTVVQASDARVLAALKSGEGFVNGLAGETWCRLFGGALA